MRPRGRHEAGEPAATHRSHGRSGANRNDYVNDIAFAELSSAGQADRASNIRRALAMADSISLVGMMGVGKSTIGKRLSQLLDIEFVDADKEIEAAAGMDVDGDLRTSSARRPSAPGNRSVIHPPDGRGTEDPGDGRRGFRGRDDARPDPASTRSPSGSTLRWTC